MGAAEIADLVLGDGAPAVGAGDGVALADDGVGAAAVLAHLAAGVGHGLLPVAFEPQDSAVGGAANEHRRPAAPGEAEGGCHAEQEMRAGHGGADSRPRGAPCQATPTSSNPGSGS